MDKSELSRMRLKELTELASRHNVPLKKKMRKSEVVEALAPALAASAKTIFSPRADLPSEAGPAPQGLPGPGMQLVVEESKYYTGPPHAEPWGLPSELPSEYGCDKISLLVRDPNWLYSYWEVTRRRLEMERASLGDATLTLRLYDITGVDFNGWNANSFRDTGVYERLGNWYLNAGAPDRSFIADLGLKTHDGRFVTLARSNPVKTPRDGASDVLDEEWVLPWPESERIFALSGGYMTGLSSADVRLAAGERVQFGIASPGISSMALMSPAMKRQRGFWFVLNTELIVYGATEPDAKVTLQGRPLQLRPDGTFTARFALPDGVQVIPVSATSADEVETRWITPTVSRQTN